MQHGEPTIATYCDACQDQKQGFGKCHEHNEVAPVGLVELTASPAQLVRDRAATWWQRSDKWHAYLERERAWQARGVTAMIVMSAIGTAAGALLGKGIAIPVACACTVVSGLLAWRGQLARVRLDTSRASEAWVVADRLAEVYRGLVTELDTMGGYCKDDRGRAMIQRDILESSQRLEAGARFGLPEQVRAALAEVTR